MLGAMRTGELAARAAVGPQTLRYCERAPEPDGPVGARGGRR
jgi:hypothetical protein